MALALSSVYGRSRTGRRRGRRCRGVSFPALHHRGPGMAEAEDGDRAAGAGAGAQVEEELIGVIDAKGVAGRLMESYSLGLVERPVRRGRGRWFCGTLTAATGEHAGRLDCTRGRRCWGNTQRTTWRTVGEDRGDGLARSSVFGSPSFRDAHAAIAVR